MVGVKPKHNQLSPEGVTQEDQGAIQTIVAQIEVTQTLTVPHKCGESLEVVAREIEASTSLWSHSFVDSLFLYFLDQRVKISWDHWPGVVKKGIMGVSEAVKHPW